MQEIEQKVYQILQQLNICYIKYDHEPLYTLKVQRH